MSRENVELVKESFAAWNRGEDAPSLMAHDVIAEPPGGWPEGGDAIGGIDAWSAQSTRLRDSWETVSIEIDEIRAVDEERVLSLFRYVTTGRESHLSFDTPMSAIHTVRRGKVVRMQFFNTLEEAVDAAERSG